MNVDDRHSYRHTGYQSLIRGACFSSAQRDIGRGSAHVECNDVANAGRSADLQRTADTDPPFDCITRSPWSVVRSSWLRFEVFFATDNGLRTTDFSPSASALR